MKRSLTALRASGHAVSNKLGLFSVLPGTRDLELVSKAGGATKKYVEKFEREGWVLESRPKVKLVKRWVPEYRVSPDSRGDILLRVPTSTGMRDDHPWHIGDADQYQVTAWWSKWYKPGSVTQIEVPDAILTRLVEQNKLPAGIEVH